MNKVHFFSALFLASATGYAQNQINANQPGDGNYAEVSQVGDKNTTTFTQYNGQHYRLVQQGAANKTVIGNLTIVSQDGVSH